MRNEIAPATALSGGNTSEDSLTASMAIFAASYAVLQADSLDELDSSEGAKSVGSQPGDAMDKAIALDEATRAL